MSRQHQIFVIAKPRGQRYRSLAATHHRYSHGIGALTACHTILRIISDEANRLPIQQELAFAAEFFENASEADTKPLALLEFPESAALAPFPFITTCLIVGTWYIPGAGTGGQVWDEPFRREYYGQYNLEGMTVIDITEPGNVRYCFVAGHDMQYRQKVPMRRPLDGWTYLKAFGFNKFDFGFDKDATTNGLEKYPLVELQSLAECWPSPDWQAAAGGSDCNDGPSNAESRKMPVPSLRTLSQNTLFQYLLSSDGFPDLTLLDLPMLFRGFKQDLQRYLIENAEGLSKSPATVEIFKKAFVGETTLDFAPFQGKLSTEDLIALASSEDMRNLKTANLSGFDSATDMEVVATVLQHNRLDHLYLLARPDRATDNLSRILEALARCPNQPLVRQKLVLGSAFSQNIRQDPSHLQKPTAVDSTYLKTFPVIQLLYSGPVAFNWRQEGEPWLTYFFLGDAYLTPVRFVTGLLSIIKGRCGNLWHFSVNRNRDVIFGFASAPSSLTTLTTSAEVSPIPAEAYARSNDVDVDDGYGPMPIRDIHPDGWTAVVVHSAIRDRPPMEVGLIDPGSMDPVREKTQYRVALVRSKQNPVPISDFSEKSLGGFVLDLCKPRKKSSELEVVDLKQFLELTAPEHAGDLEAVLSELTNWAQTDDNLVSKLEMDETIATLKAFAEYEYEMD